MKEKFLLLGLFLALLLLAGCSGTKEEVTDTPEGGTEMAIQISSTAFTEGELIPKNYTCDGDDASPALSWSGIPTGTQSVTIDPLPDGTWYWRVRACTAANACGAWSTTGTFTVETSVSPPVFGTVE